MKILLDTETTGLSDDDRVCELTLALVDDNWAVSKMETYQFDPGMPVSKGAAEINGLEWERDLLGKPPFDTNTVAAWLSTGYPVYAYNASFDKRMLTAEFRRAGQSIPQVEWRDALKKARSTLQLDRYRLVDVAGHFGIDTKGAHSAERDVEILLGVCRGLAAIPTNGSPQAITAGGHIDLTPFQNMFRSILDVTMGLEARTHSQSEIVDGAVNKLQQLRNKIEKERKAMVAEPTAIVRAINSQFKVVRDAIDAEKDRLDGLVKGYLMREDTPPVAATPTVGKSIRTKVYNIMYAHVVKDMVPLEFLKIDDFAIECEIKRQLAAGITPPSIPGVPMESDYVVKRRAR